MAERHFMLVLLLVAVALVATVQGIPTIDCRLVYCAKPSCFSPLPPPPGQCCHVCPPHGGCKFNGRFWPVGSSFPHGDGCNKCYCIAPNRVVCTKIACFPPTCPPDKPMVYCFVDPCQVTSCPAHPDAKCVADYCGGCFARFFNRYGVEVTDTCNSY